METVKLILTIPLSHLQLWQALAFGIKLFFLSRKNLSAQQCRITKLNLRNAFPVETKVCPFLLYNSILLQFATSLLASINRFKNFSPVFLERTLYEYIHWGRMIESLKTGIPVSVFNLITHLSCDFGEWP